MFLIRASKSWRKFIVCEFTTYLFCAQQNEWYQIIIRLPCKWRGSRYLDIRHTAYCCFSSLVVKQSKQQFVSAAAYSRFSPGKILSTLNFETMIIHNNYNDLFKMKKFHIAPEKLKFGIENENNEKLMREVCDSSVSRNSTSVGMMTLIASSWIISMCKIPLNSRSFIMIIVNSFVYVKNDGSCRESNSGNNFFVCSFSFWMMTWTRHKKSNTQRMLSFRPT